MTRYLLAGGGTAGHVNPLLAVADRVMEREPDAVVSVLGTTEGLESRLVPQRGYELVVVPKLPFPRRPNGAAVRFPREFLRSVARIRAIIRERDIDVVVGFGGYVSAPAYVAARREHIPLVIHEANAKPGIANRLGSRLSRFVGVAFRGTPLRHARFVGMPLRREIERLDRAGTRPEAVAFFGLDESRPTLLVTGGSQGAKHLNETVLEVAADVVAAGWQVLHIAGERFDLEVPELPQYHVLAYCDRMDLALAATDLALSRAGSATVSELTALGIPAVYVPLAFGNGEQRLNAAEAVRVGAARLVENAQFAPRWVRAELMPLLDDRDGLVRMSERARSIGVLDGADRTVALVGDALAGRVH
ncbi:UDP-N-acetylglucosamine--N-acetylmuramyl-(pentapeptide) pyrophosphoryl-undecaprenol N-acetylglucosamine transferase [Parafrigoribacterium humi]|jgi:UDP-N-acetylglucosamine--N-acetylmuramyl-(pentapeptide) pyrophosphoryl-undecaprenol N-acetylglucosamine transferase|uniref:UDP-N-acetylglucosamine--N-acetylmuramyl- (pentapeptide) pyrophosphoryl-undecaprenol N-acetylglucosamine transferase n=1 Tax=Parafrigoribacterium humi TaxID=3144664 RepID=UPI0032EF4EEE